ncbi:hypothetical protein [Calothrix sp. NIES-2100]|uniref:hypothetical protein n=1 Tax=Calothrix sp. NIES-2100 TaxID=1954172 RepID=UPI0030DA0D85
MSDVAVQSMSDRFLLTIIHLWISAVAVQSMKFRVLNSERRVIYSKFRVIICNVAALKCNY